MYNEKGILWKSILEIQGIPLIVIPYRYGVLTLIFNNTIWQRPRFSVEPIKAVIPRFPPKNDGFM